MGLKYLAGGAVGGAFAIQFVPTPFVVVGIFVGLSYFVVRLLVWAVRWAIEKIRGIDACWPDLPRFDARRRMDEVMALADARILGLQQELATAEARVGELETERDGLERARRTAEAHIEQLQHELQSAREALQAAGEELRSRPQEPDPLYRRVGLDRDCPPFVLQCVRKEFRRRLHPDGHPEHRKQACHERFVEAEQVFNRIYSLRGMKA